MNRIVARLIWLVVLSWPGCLPSALAQGNLMQPAAVAPAVHFMPPTALDVSQVLPPPPAANSVAAEADLAVVLQVQAWRTPEEVAWARVVEKQTIVTIYGDLFGPWFNAGALPQLLALIKDITDDVRPLSEAAKKKYARARPYTIDARVKPCVDAPPNETYPSGHALAEYLMAGVLVEIFPERRADLFARAQRAAWGRIIGGVHFPTDLEAGRVLAAAVMVELKKSAAFKAALEKCRGELAVASKQAA